MGKIKKNKISNYMIIGISYIVILLTISTAYSFLNEDLSLKVTIGIPQSGKDYTINSTEILNKTESNISYYGYDLILTYLGKNPTTGWEVYLKIPFDTEVTECYQASSCTVEGNVLTIKNDTYNGELSLNNTSTSFGIKFKTSKTDYLLDIIGVKFIEKNAESSKEPVIAEPNITTVEYIKASYTTLYDRGSSKQYTLKIENTSNDSTIHSWTTTFHIPFDASISSLWGGEKNYDEAIRLLTISGPAWSPSLPPKANIEVNMIINSPSGTPPTLLELIGITSTGEKVQGTIHIGGH